MIDKEMIIEEFEHGNCRVRIIQDDEPMSPRDATNLGIMLAINHRNYVLGDAEFKRNVPEWDAACAGFNELGGRLGDFPAWAKENLGASVVLPLWLYDHSGLAMSTGSFAMDAAGWDSGIVGFIFDTPRTREECGTPEDRIEEVLKGEVETYDAFLRGSAVGYLVETMKGGACGHENCPEHQGWEHVDSCWGYLIVNDEEMEYVRSEARFAAEHA